MLLCGAGLAGLLHFNENQHTILDELCKIPAINGTRLFVSPQPPIVLKDLGDARRANLSKSNHTVAV